MLKVLRFPCVFVHEGKTHQFTRVQFVYEQKTRWATHIHIVYEGKTLKVCSYTYCTWVKNALGKSYTYCIRAENTPSRLVYILYMSRKFYKSERIQFFLRKRCKSVFLKILYTKFMPAFYLFFLLSVTKCFKPCSNALSFF